MKVIALGTNAAYAAPGNACSGWLLQDGGANILLDCGTGVIARLQEFIDLTEITGIVISHMHADHFFDLVPLRHALRYGPNQGRVQPALYLPPGGIRAMSAIAEVVHPADYASEEFLDHVFHVTEFGVDAPLRLGNLQFDFAPGNHYVPSWAMAISSLDHTNHRLVYTGDTGPAEAIMELARNADLLVSESTYLGLEEEHGTVRGHLTAQEAGELAARANVQRALLTHQWPHRDRGEVLERAQSAFDGPIANAEVGAEYPI